MRGKLLECADPDVAECICNLGSSLVSRSSFAGPLRRDIPLAFAPPKASTHLPYPSSQAPLWAGEWFVSQCKYSFSLSKTYFPTTVKRRGGCFKRGGGKDRESVCVSVFWEWGLPPLLSPLFSLLLPASSSHIWHCLSPGLLVQAERKTLEQEHSANLRSTVAALQDKSD